MPELLASLAETFGLVAVVSGRPTEYLRRLLQARGVEVFGLYGLEAVDAPGGAVRAALPEVERVAATVPGARVEDKGASVAVHYRGAPDTASAEAQLVARIGEVAGRHGLKVMPGKMVLELAPAEIPGKGHIVLREVSRRGLARCLYAGDDLADMHAFAALDELRAGGVEAVKVAVRSDETPEELLRSADLVVDGPSALVRLLRDLVDA